MMMINSFNLQCSTSTTSDNCHRKITPATQILLHPSTKPPRARKDWSVNRSHVGPTHCHNCNHVQHVTHRHQKKGTGFTRFGTFTSLLPVTKVSSFISPFFFPNLPFFFESCPHLQARFASVIMQRHLWESLLDEFSE